MDKFDPEYCNEIVTCPFCGACVFLIAWVNTKAEVERTGPFSFRFMKTDMEEVTKELFKAVKNHECEGINE